MGNNYLLKVLYLSKEFMNKDYFYDMIQTGTMDEYGLQMYS